MITDGKGLVTSESHVSRYDVDRLFAVTIGEIIFNGIKRHSFPSSLLVFHVAGGDLIEIHFAEVVEQGGDGDALVGIADAVQVAHAGTSQNVHQGIVDVKTMLTQPPLVVAMVAGGGGSGKEITAVGSQISQQLFAPLTGDLGLKNINESLSVFGRAGGIIDVGHE